MSLKISLRRFKFWWSLTLAYISRYKVQLLAILASIFLLIYVIYRIAPLVNQRNTVDIGYVGVYSLETIPTQILSLATQSLITQDENGRPIPQLAANWQVSEDGKTYVVFLKDNLRWHDSSSVEAKDITVAISQVKITALNNKAIEFNLESPVSSFPQALDKPVFKSKSFYGTGQFRIVDIDQKENIVKKINLVPKDDKLPKVNIKFYQTEEQALHALKIGEVKSIRVAHAAGLADWKTVDVEKQIENSEIITIFFNTQDPLLSSKDLRQALSHAINKSGFDGITASSPISPKSWAYNDSVKKYDYNTGRAKELLSKSGSVKPKIKLTVTSGLESIAQQIKEDWSAIGVETELVAEKSIPENFQALLVVNKLNPDPDQYALWHSTQLTTNITKYQDEKIDKLLEDGRSERDEAKRKQLYFDFQRFLVEDAPAAFLYHPYKYQITYKNISQLISKLPK